MHLVTVPHTSLDMETSILIDMGGLELIEMSLNAI